MIVIGFYPGGGKSLPKLKAFTPVKSLFSLKHILLLLYKNEIVGTVLRTRFNVKPVFVPVGHNVNLEQATDFILNCTTRYRIPDPTRLAHNIVSEYRKSLI